MRRVAAFNFVIHLLAALTCFVCALLLFREAARSRSGLARRCRILGFVIVMAAMIDRQHASQPRGNGG